jgi:hypothetical protein
MLYWVDHLSEETSMRNNLKRVLGDTRKVISTRWSASNLHVPSWAINAVIYITLIRSFSYGVELFILGNSAAVSPLAVYTAILGIHIWGALILVGVLVLSTGLLLRNSIVVTVGVLLCVAVWASLGITLTFGALVVGTGLRFAIAALATAATWAVFFGLQLKTIRRNGVES